MKSHNFRDYFAITVCSSQNEVSYPKQLSARERPARVFLFSSLPRTLCQFGHCLLHIPSVYEFCNSNRPVLFLFATSSDELPVQLTLPRAMREAKNRQQLSSLALLGQEFWRYPMANPKPPAESSSSNTSSLSSFHGGELLSAERKQLAIANDRLVKTSSRNRYFFILSFITSKYARALCRVPRD